MATTDRSTPTTSSRSGRSGRSRTGSSPGAGGGSAVYGLGFIGALVFFWQQADAFGAYVMAVLKAFVWPALLVYQALQGLHA